MYDLPEDAWVLYPDSDEFFEFDCDVKSRIKAGEDIFWGRMIDHYSADFSFPDLKATPSIQEQYPVPCPGLRWWIGAGAKDWKHMLFKAHVGKLHRQMGDSHDVKPGLLALHQTTESSSTNNLQVLDTTGHPKNELQINGFPHYSYMGRAFYESLNEKLDLYSHENGKHTMNDMRRDALYLKMSQMYRWDGGPPSANATEITLSSYGSMFTHRMCKPAIKGVRTTTLAYDSFTLDQYLPH